jgi:hypothetical protein
MDPIPPEAFLAAFPEPIRAIGDRLRTLVLATNPDAVERVRPGWHLIGYDAPAPTTSRGRRSAYFAYIAPEREHIHLGFEHGWLMADPDARLEGTGITRQVRWLTFRAGDTLDAAVIEPLILEARRVALLPREERFEAAMAARST